MHTRLALATLVTLVLVPSCGGPDALSPDAVQNIPPGTATGSALSGEYDGRRETTGCSGTCAITVSGFRVSVCDVGTIDESSATITQDDGTLDLEVSDTPSSYRGGVDADGGFDIGAYATEDGGSLVITARVEGTITASGFSGTATSRSRGTYSGQALNCFGTYTVSGTRL